MRYCARARSRLVLDPMTQATLVLSILGVTVALFASDRLRVDLVALLSLLALVAVGAASGCCCRR